VINIPRRLNTGTARLHHASCRTIGGQPPAGRTWTGPYLKVCADAAGVLDEWALEHAGAIITRCGTCQPSGSGLHGAAKVTSSAATTPPPKPARHVVRGQATEIGGPWPDRPVVEAWAEEYIRFQRRSPTDVLLEALHLSDTLAKRALSEVEAGAVTPKRLRELVDASACASALARTVLSAEAEAVRAGSANEIAGAAVGQRARAVHVQARSVRRHGCRSRAGGGGRGVASASWVPLAAAAEKRFVRLAEEQGNFVHDVLESVLSSLALDQDVWMSAAMAAGLRAVGLGDVRQPEPPPRSWWITLAKRACAQLGLPDPMPVLEILPPLRCELTDGRGP
jgi:hypothetical protein